MRKGLILIVLGFSFFVIGCKEPDQPSISQEKMIDILIDVHLIEASLLGFSEEQKDSLSLAYYDQIYQIHSISEEEFIEGMEYLKGHPDYMTKTYEKVLEEIDKKEAEMK